MIRVVLFDLDGVIRIFDSDYVADIELRYGIPQGTLDGFAFAKPLIEDVTSGRITRADWVRRVGELCDNPAAADEWGVQPATVDEDILELSDEIRRLGLHTAVLTNGTDEVASELADLGIAGRFDAIFNSAEIGYVKPDVRAFQHVLDALNVTGPEVFFTDDSETKLAGADSLSMPTHLYRGINELRNALAESGVPVPVVSHLDE
jgi:putative hydrolase of the HAD superfamily